jgi:hypothetical protein
LDWLTIPIDRFLDFSSDCKIDFMREWIVKYKRTYADGRVEYFDQEHYEKNIHPFLELGGKIKADFFQSHISEYLNIQKENFIQEDGIEIFRNKEEIGDFSLVEKEMIRQWMSSFYPNTPYTITENKILIFL